jgi:hypothetical protein
MARFYVSFIFFLTPILLGWLLLNGHDPRPDSQPWWRHENHNGFVYDTIDALVAYFGPMPVAIACFILGPVAGALTFFVIKPRTIWGRRRWF